MTHQLQHLIYQAPYRTAFAVITDDLELAQTMKVQYGSHLREEMASIPCKVVSILREGRQFRVAFESESVLVEDPLYSFSAIIFRHTEYDNSVLALHGAAVEWKGKAYLFLAHTSGGKTTLTSYLVSCGFGYLSDDCILLDRNTWDVYPSPKPVHLRNGGLAVLRNLGIDPQCQMVGTPPNERYVYMPETVVTNPLPIGDIFFIDRTADQNFIEELPMNQRIENLMRSPITPYSVSGEYLRVLLRLAGKGCRVLHYSDMNYVRNVVQEHALQNLT